MQQTQVIAAQNESIVGQTRLLERQLSLATEPAVKILSIQAEPNLSGVFTLYLVNSGSPTITDINIGKEFYLLRGQEDADLKQIEVGGQSTGPAVSTTRLKVYHQIFLDRDEIFPFEIALPDGYEDLMAEGTLLALVNVRFAREVDLRQSELVRVFSAQKEGYLNDITMYGLEALPALREARDSLVARAILNNIRERGARNPATPAHSGPPLRDSAGR